MGLHTNDRDEIKRVVRNSPYEPKGQVDKPTTPVTIEEGHSSFDKPWGLLLPNLKKRTLVTYIISSGESSMSSNTDADSP